MRSRSPTRHRAAPSMCLLLLALACSPRAPVAGSSRAPAAPIAEPPTAGSPFGPTVANLGPPPGPAPSGMVWIPGGEFSMGEETLPDARPVHRVYVDGFWMDRTEVTNSEFARFVRATGYRTVAEHKLRAEDFPGVDADALVPGSLVFTPPPHPVPLDSDARWWAYVQRASWQHPAGSADRLQARENYPVVQVAYEDAGAYARWAGKRLPSEAEYEFAARGGLAGKRYAWGDDLRPDGKWMANTFQGHFPDHDSGDDGWRGVAPVASFPPNRYGLYDIAGNVWEWCRDWYRADAYTTDAASGKVARNPTGPASSDDPTEPGARKRVQRGGSFLCSSTFCTRYLVGARGRGEISTGTNHLGFRCVLSPGPR
jgi:formylglycine-generating enzyme